MSVELISWDDVKPAEINRLARNDAAIGVVPILMMIEPSGDVRVVSPLSAHGTAHLFDAAAHALHMRGLQ